MTKKAPEKRTQRPNAGDYEVRILVVREGSPGKPVERPSKVYEMFRFLENCDVEEFWMATLDARNRITGTKMLSRGTLDASIVHPRDVFKVALGHNAASVILVHNHPSGDPNPSAEDRSVTERIEKAGDLMGISVLDHVIIGLGGYTSFKEERLISRHDWQKEAFR